MTDMGFTPVPGAVPVSPEVADAQAKAQLQAAAQAAPKGEASQTTAAIAASERGPLLPAEVQMDQIMALLKKQADELAALQSRVGVQQAQLDQANAAAGGPLLTRYADAVVEDLLGQAGLLADAGRVRTVEGKPVVEGHFAAPYDLAVKLQAQARAIQDGGTDAAGLDATVTKLERWIERTHPRSRVEAADFGRLRQYLDSVVEESDRLVAA